MRASRSVSIFLIISFIAAFMYSDLFTNKAVADVAPWEQIIVGYLASGVGYILGCSGGCLVAEDTMSYDEMDWVLPFGGGIGCVLASSYAVYAVGEDSAEIGSFGWTLLGGVAPPAMVGACAGIIAAMRGEKPKTALEAFGWGCYSGILLAPIGETITYHMTKEENNPGKKEVIVPLMRMRF